MALYHLATWDFTRAPWLGVEASVAAFSSGSPAAGVDCSPRSRVSLSPSLSPCLSLLSLIVNSTTQLLCQQRLESHHASPKSLSPRIGACERTIIRVEVLCVHYPALVAMVCRRAASPRRRFFFGICIHHSINYQLGNPS